MQSNLDWHFAQNQFLNRLSQSYRRTNVFAIDHVAKLSAQVNDPTIQQLYTRSKGLLDTFINKYAGWRSKVGYYKGETFFIDQILSKIRSEKAARWDVQIQIVFAQGSTDYIKIFPAGRTGFNDGGKDERMSKVKSLADTLSTYPQLNAVYTEVEAYVQQLFDARRSQQQHEQAVMQAATELRAIQSELLIMIYRNTGALIDLFGNDPAQILNYYELELIRSVQSDANSSAEEEKSIEPIIEDRPEIA